MTMEVKNEGSGSFRHIIIRQRLTILLDERVPRRAVAVGSAICFLKGLLHKLVVIGC